MKRQETTEFGDSPSTKKDDMMKEQDESFWQEFLTKGTKEVKDSVSSISTVKDYMVNQQDVLLLQESSTKDTKELEGYIHCLSPVKDTINKRANFFFTSKCI